MKGKIIIIIALLVVMNLRALDTFLNVITGNIGNYENWRITFSLLGFLITLIASVFIYNSARKKGII